MKKMELLFKLLKQNINAWQIFGFVIANLLGGTIVLIGIQAYQDFNRFINKESGLLSEGYMVVTKPINGMTTLTNLFGVQPSFSEKEIKQIEEHPEVKEIGRFTAANFSLRGSFSLADLNISTDMFMESVPDRFIDVEFDSPDTWKADINSNKIPVIIPRRYLNIYNYGYASTKGLPQLGEGLTSAFPVTIKVSGNGQTCFYSAKIVGFTDRLNTILVPEKFLSQANEKFATSIPKRPSRLIVSTHTNGGNNTFLEFLEEKGYAVEGDMESLRLKTLVNGILWVMIGIGGIVSVLAFLLLLISIQLLIEKNKEKFINLHSLGYTIRNISAPYLWMVVIIDSLVWFIAVSIVSIIYPNLFAFFSAISPDLKLASLLPLWGIAIGFAIVFVLLHRWVIVRQLRKICLLFLCMLLLSCGNGKTQKEEAGNDSVRITTTEKQVYVERIDTMGIQVLYPKFSKVDLICGQMPAKSDSSVIMVAAAAFTGQCVDSFYHKNVAGDHVSNGKRFKGYKCTRNTGAFVFYNSKWKFLFKSYSDEMDNAASNGGAAFAQEMIVHKGALVGTVRKDSNKNVFRALCCHNDRLCIIETKETVSFGDFKKMLIEYGVSDALYIDMGAGWNHAWYRDGKETIDLHPKIHNYCTNWIAFY